MAKADHNRKPGDPADPLILALDCSTRAGSVALARGEAVLGEVSFAARPHSEALLPAVDFLLKTCGARVRDVDAFAVTRGPGAFTGLRIGITTAKGLARAGGKPLLAVSTLEALAFGVSAGASLISTTLDARRGEVWAALWASGPEGPEMLEKERGAAPEAWAETVARAADRPVLFAGDGAALYGGIFREKLGERYLVAEPLNHLVRAGTVAALGLRALRRGEAASLEALAPTYLRGGEAQIFDPAP